MPQYPAEAETELSQSTRAIALRDIATPSAHVNLSKCHRGLPLLRYDHNVVLTEVKTRHN